MRKPRKGHLAGILLLALPGLGCRHHIPAPFPEWGAVSTVYAPHDDSENAFDAYAMSALAVERDGGKYLTQVLFYPDQRKAVQRLCAGPLADVIKATRLPCHFEYTPHPPFVAPPYHVGWRLMGRALKWSIDDACAAANYDLAIDDLIVATRFGFDLTGGGATDASLGFAIVDDARVSIASYLPKMGASQLQRLSDSVEKALARRPDLADAIRHDGEDIHLAVQALQDSLQKDDFDQISTCLGPTAKEAVDYLRDLRDDDAKRTAYFKDFAAEGDAETRFLLDNVALPAQARGKDSPADPPKSKPGERAAGKPIERKERPWHNFSRPFFLSAAPLLVINDRTVARTRLLALNAEVIKAFKIEKAYPKDIHGFAADLVTDPYTGAPFLYRADAAEYVLYSVGENLQDDAGDTDDSFSSPDLKLEMKE